MGVDWLVCKQCGDTFPDCGDFVYCNTCDNQWCSDECAEADGYRVDKEETYDYEQITSCKYCRQEDFSDSELLNYTLNILGVTRDELIIMYKKINNNK